MHFSEHICMDSSSNWNCSTKNLIALVSIVDFQFHFNLLEIGRVFTKNLKKKKFFNSYLTPLRIPESFDQIITAPGEMWKYWFPSLFWFATFSLSLFRCSTFSLSLFWFASFSLSLLWFSTFLLSPLFAALHSSLHILIFSRVSNMKAHQYHHDQNYHSIKS